MAFDHFNPGGVFCTNAEGTVECFENNSFRLLNSPGGEVIIPTARHVGGIFPAAAWLKLLQEAGFEVYTRELEGVAMLFMIGVKASRLIPARKTIANARHFRGRKL